METILGLKPEEVSRDYLTRSLVNHFMVFTHCSTDNAKQLSNIELGKDMMRFAFLKPLFGASILNGMILER